MTDLTPTQNSTPAKITSPVLSEALTSLLDSNGSPDQAVREIVGTPALIAEVRASLPALQHVATAHAGQAGVKAVIGKRLALYPQPQRSEGEWNAWWADYFDVLADTPLASLEAGMRAYVADPSSEFMPKPGRLKELAFTAPCRSLARYYRAKMAVAKADEAPAIAGPPADPAEVRALLAEFQSRSSSERAKPDFMATPVRTDAGGLSAAMRESMARRAEMGR